MMRLLLFVSILSCLTALVWFVVLLRRVIKIRHLGIATATVGLLALSQTHPLFAAHVSSTSSTTGSAALIVSIAALLIFLLYDRILATRKLMTVKPQALLETALDAMVLVDQNGAIMMVNAQTEALFGYTRTELLGASVECLVPEPLRTRHRKHRADYLAHPKMRPMGTNLILHGQHKDGSTFPLEISLSPLETEQGLLISCAIRDTTGHKKARETLRQSHRFLMGKTSRVVVAHENITERKQAEEQLLYQANLLQNVLDAVIVTDLNFTIQSWNRAAETLYGWQTDEVIGKRMAEVVPITYRDACRENVLAQFREEGVWKGEVIQQRRDGTTVDILSSVTMICDSAGQPTGVISINRDITERKQAEERETRLGRILEHSLNEIYIFDADTLHFLEVNRGARENVGYSFDELRTLTPLDLKPEFTPETFTQLLEPLRTGAREKIEFTTVHRRKDGSLYPVEVHLQLSTWQRSTVFVAIILDITKHKQAEQALRTSEERYRRVVEDQTEYVMRWLPDGTVLFANDSYCRYFGVASGEIEGANVFDLIPEVDHVRLRQKIASLRPESPLVREEHPVTRPDGSRGWHDWNDRAILDEAGRIVEYQSVGRDITERKQAEEALQVSEERNRALLDGIPDMMFRLRTDGTFLDYKAESEEELAVPPEAIIGSTLAQSPMPAAIVDDMMRCVEQAMTRGKVQTYEYELSVPMGIQTYEARFVRSGADEIVCIVRNVTERKRAEAEQERLIDELEARNAELERFTYTVSHDLKTPLVTIKGFLGLLMKDVKAGHEEAFEHDIEQISNAADQMARLLAELLELSRIGHVINPSEEVS